VTSQCTGNAPPPADAEPNGVPDWVEDVVQPTFANVWQKEIVDRGNPAPLSDDTSDNDGGQNEGDPDKVKLDIYLADVGASGFFGFCTSDDPRLDPGSTYQFFDVSAYCVIDNDFGDFGSEWSPQEFLQVTAAHEFRHASQFAEDAFAQGAEAVRVAECVGGAARRVDQPFGADLHGA